MIGKTKAFVKGKSLAYSNDVDSLKTSVSSGKQKIASAVTDKGVSTAGTATFDVIASNIRKISTVAVETAGATATAADIVNGKTAWAKGIKLVGTAPTTHALILQTTTDDSGNFTIPPLKVLPKIVFFNSYRRSNQDSFKRTGCVLDYVYNVMIRGTPKKLLWINTMDGRNVKRCRNFNMVQSIVWRLWV